MKRIFLTKHKVSLEYFLYYRAKLNSSKIKVVSPNFQTCLHSRGGSRKFRKSWSEAVVFHFHQSSKIHYRFCLEKRFPKKQVLYYQWLLNWHLLHLKSFFLVLHRKATFKKGSEIYPYHCKCSDPR